MSKDTNNSETENATDSEQVRGRQSSDLLAELESVMSETEKRLIDAEAILDQMSSGYWKHALNEAGEGMKVGDQIEGYWKKWSGENAQVHTSARCVVVLEQ